MARRVIIFRLGSIGDMVVALPCLNLVAEAFADCERIALTNIPMSNKTVSMAEILAPAGFIHGSIAYPLATRSPRVLFEVAAQIRRLEPEALVYLAGGESVGKVLRNLAFFRFCGVRRVVGAPLTSDLARARPDPATGDLESESSRLARCLAPLGEIDLDNRAGWDLRLTPAERRAADEFLSAAPGEFIAINTGGKLPIQDWGEENWATLLDRLSLPLNAAPSLVFVGGADDHPRAQRLAERWPHARLNACGVLTPRETAAVLSRARLFVGHDSGPLHLAAAVGTVCVAMYGPNNRPRQWHPYGADHRVFHDMTGVANIPPQAVADAVSEAWLDRAHVGERKSDQSAS